MKTTGIKVNGYRLAMIGLVLGLAMTMQAVDYKNVYKHSVVSHQYSDNGIEAATPSTGFRSTSAYSGQWNQDAQQSLLNTDGSVNTEAYMGGPRRVGGATYQVPVEVTAERGVQLSIRWIVMYARAKKGMPMKERLMRELMDAYKNEGASIKRRDDTHRMAEANRAFAHYRF